MKDRIGVAMIDAAEAEGVIEPGRTTIVESTSGNTGIALAFVCAARGYELVLTMPQGMSREREKLVRLYGAEVELVESLGGMNEAVDEARRIAADRGDGFIPDQFSNPANPEIHRRTTAEEIWRDMEGRVDVLVAGVGTGGTITGLRRAAEGAQPGPARGGGGAAAPRPCSRGSSPGPHKIQGIGAGFVPARPEPRGDRRGRDGGRRGRDRHRAPVRPARGRARRHLLRRRAVGRDRGGLAPGDARRSGWS